MIQRIQTLYLITVSILMVVMLSVPLGKFLIADEEFALKAFGVYSLSEGGNMLVGTQYMGILMTMAAILPLLTIFLYKNRLLQIRFCFMELVFLMGVQVFVVYYLYHATTGFSQAGVESYVTYSVADLLPIVCLILTWLAYRAIVKDEALVRSLDRIR